MPTLARRLWLLLRLEAGLGSRQHQDGLRLCIRGALAQKEWICIVVTTSLVSRMQIHSLRPSKTYNIDSTQSRLSQSFTLPWFRYHLAVIINQHNPSEAIPRPWQAVFWGYPSPPQAPTCKTWELPIISSEMHSHQHKLTHGDRLILSLLLLRLPQVLRLLQLVNLGRVLPHHLQCSEVKESGMESL